MVCGEDFVRVKDGQKRTTWDGGYVRHGKKGPVYVIERWVDGFHFHVSTRCRTSGAAHEQLKRFEADPVQYRPSGDGAQRLLITAQLVADYREWMRLVKKNSDSWAFTCERMLIEWAEDFGGRDLRRVTLHQDIEPALERRGTSRKHRIEALKAFCKWLRRRKGLLTAKDDPTLDLPVPPSEPGSVSRAVPEERISAILPYLPETAQDVLLVQMGSGAHISEIRRFATSGRMAKEGKTKAILYMVHKTKREKPFPLKGRVYVEAAERIKARGSIPADWTLNTDATKACEMAGVERFTFGVIRHSFATNAFKRGATMGQVGDALHHSSAKTTKNHYVIGMPPKPVTPLRVVAGGKR